MAEHEFWESNVPTGLMRDTLWRSDVYRRATCAVDVGWDDVTQLNRDWRTRSTADQLQRALGSIGANIAEGFGKRSGRERAHYYEGALGSAREARHHYFSGRRVLGDQRANERIEEMNDIVFLLLSAIPRERRRDLG